MNLFWIGIFIGLFIEACIGFFLAALCAAASHSDAHLREL